MTVFVCVSIAILLLLAASASDLAARMVSNRLCVALGFDGLTMQMSAHALPVAMLTTAAVFVPAVVCWRHGVMGGGDVKLLTVATLLVQPAAVPMLILSIALAGGVLGAAYWTMTRILSSPVTRRPSPLLLRILRVERYRITRGFALPYAVAISFGTFFMFGHGLAS